jgi:hypothetical protein
MSSVHTIVLTFNLVQQRTCSIPKLRSGKKSVICSHPRFFVSLSLINNASSSGVDLVLDLLTSVANFSAAGYPTTDGAGAACHYAKQAAIGRTHVWSPV